MELGNDEMRNAIQTTGKALQVSSLRKCSFHQNYTPNCNIEEMRGGSVFNIIPHSVTNRANLNLVNFLGNFFS